MKVLDALAAKGVGLGFAHYGVEVPPGPPGEAMHRWIGGYYEDHYSVNPMWKPPFDKLPSHPITRGVGPFATHDEWYFNMRWSTDPAVQKRVTPILVATPSDEVRKGPYVSPKGPYDHIIAASGQAETMMWVFERPDGGRGLGFTGGHTHANWGDANQRRIFLNGLLWLAKVDVPAKGVVGPHHRRGPDAEPGRQRRPASKGHGAQRQRNSFSASVKQTTSQAARVASCGASCARRCSLQHVRAQRVDHRRQRQRPDDRLHDVRETAEPRRTRRTGSTSGPAPGSSGPRPLRSCGPRRRSAGRAR